MPQRPIFRFAPSPNGYLHLGHAYSALLNKRMTAAYGGRLLLRMEDIDTTRCTSAFEAQIYDDLQWLGLQWDRPVRRQSEHFGEYELALKTLIQQELVYPSFLSRKALRNKILQKRQEGSKWPIAPDGTPLYPIDERYLSKQQITRLIEAGEPFAYRLNMDEAMRRFGQSLDWHEIAYEKDGTGRCIEACPDLWGDVVIARKEIPTSYHLSVVIDDALQEVTHIVRGYDLFQATAVHRLLQQILALPQPVYHHHRLILTGHGRKLSKSNHDTALLHLRQAGAKREDIYRATGL